MTGFPYKHGWENHEDAEKDVDGLYEKLKALTNVNDAVKAAHVADIERKYKQNRLENRSL